MKTPRAWVTKGLCSEKRQKTKTHQARTIDVVDQQEVQCRLRPFLWARVRIESLYHFWFNEYVDVEVSERMCQIFCGEDEKDLPKHQQTAATSFVFFLACFKEATLWLPP